MMDNAMLLTYFAETPLHPGTGQSTGVVDLPVQRETPTGFPVLPATSLKGSLRAEARRRWQDADGVGHLNALFGPDVGNAALHAGALRFTDARLLAFPVRSVRHVFLWVTCPLVLSRLRRDLSLAGFRDDGLAAESPAEAQLVTADSDLGERIALEDMAFDIRRDSEWAAVARKISELLPATDAHRAYREKMACHLCLLHDDDFAYLATHATEITARIQLNPDTKTTGEGGNLWYEETIPGDTLFYSLVAAEPPRVDHEEMRSAVDVANRFRTLLADEPLYLQIGGNETVGQGWCAVRVVRGFAEGA